METKNHNQILELKDELNDMILLAYLVDLATGVEDAWKLMKLSFFFDLEAFKNEQYGFNAEFFKFNQGAYSKDISQLKNKLEYSHFFTNADVYASLSTIGYEHLEHVEEITKFKKTKEFDTLQSIVNKHKDSSGRELMELHYDEEVRELKKVKDYEMHATILSKYDFENRKSIVEDLSDEKVYELYLRFLFSETYDKDKWEILPDKYSSFDQLINEMFGR